MDKAEKLLDRATMASLRPVEPSLTEHVKALARLAEVHIKAAQILKDW